MKAMTIIQKTFLSQIIQIQNVGATMQVAVAYFSICFPLYICCDFGNRVTQGFEEVEIELNQLPWYLFPLDVQKNVPMMIALSQKSMLIKGFGSADCNRETYKLV